MTITTDSNFIKIFDGNRLTQDNLKEIRYLFENNKLPVIDNVFSNDIIKFIKENVNVDTVPIQCQEDGYKEWKPKYKKIGDLNSFLNILDKKDKTTLGKVSDLFSKIENTINNFVHNILGYKVLSVSRTYRFTMTLRENLHFDNFEPTRPGIGFLRVFVNLDEDERIWNNSLNIYDYINLKNNEIKKYLIENKIKAEYSGNNRINDLVMKYFMDSGFNDKMDEIFDDNIPKIQTKFSPGSIWICDSIKSSHQVIYGNKCISFNYVIDGNTFDSKDNLYHNRINPILNRLNHQDSIEIS